MTADLVAFLRARLDEDQAHAQDAGSHIGGDPWALYGYDQDDHLCIHQSRALAEMQAKRAILDELERLGHLPLNLPEDLQYVGAHQALLGAARWLALPYQDHPDYRQEWRPQ